MNFFLKMRMTIYIVILIISISCSNENSEYIIFSDRISLSNIPENAEVVVSIDERFSNRYDVKQVVNDSLLFGFQPFDKDDRIDVIHLYEPSQNKVIKVEDYEINNGFNSFYVHSLDSILLVSGSLKQFFWINFEGKVFSKIKLDQFAHSEFEMLPFLQNRPLYSKGKIFFNYRSLGLLGDSKYLKEPQLATYELSTGKVEQFGEAPFLVDYLNGKEVSTDFYSPNILLTDEDQLVVSYPFYPFLLIYDTKSNKLIQKVPMYSGLVKQMSPPAKKDIHSDNFRNAAYRAGIPVFWDISYHKDVERYSIVLMHPYQSLNESGRLRDWGKRKSSLLLLDKNFEIVREIEFLDGSLLMNASVALSNGLLYAKHINNETRQDILHYYNFLLVN